MDSHLVAAPVADTAEPDSLPLVVDLDGTLLRSDALWESLFALARTCPLCLVKLPRWFFGGRAYLKRKLAETSALDVSTLPLDEALVTYLRAQKRDGRRLVLASGADARIANAVANRCQLFDAVIASDGVVNMTSHRKRDRLIEEFGAQGFDYIGNSAQDLPVWAVARHGLLVGPLEGLQRWATPLTHVHTLFAREAPTVSIYLGAMRVQHWLKNLLLLVPILFNHSLYDPDALASAMVGALCFCLAASGVYLLNDLLDLGADRLHPHKKQRALASGQLPIGHALVLLPCLWLAALLLALTLPSGFLGVLGIYVALMVAYSIRLKNIAVIDALALAAGYSLRILAGALAVDVDVSPWLLVCSSAMFFGLALLKRYAELIALRSTVGTEGRVRAYHIADSTILVGLGAAAGCIAVALLALYPLVESSPHDRWPVWLVCSFLLFWIGHMWLMAHRGNIHEDPVAFAVHDPVSLTFGMLTVIVLLAAL